MKYDIENPDSLHSFLKGWGKIREKEQGTLEILAGGVSNKTVLFTRETGEQWVIKQALNRLRVEQDWYCSPNRLQIEYQGMEWLSQVLPEGSVPHPVFFNPEHNILAMEAIARPHENLKTLLLRGTIPFERIRDLGELLAAMHRAGSSEAARQLFSNRDFFQTLRLDAYYNTTANRLPATVPFFRKLIRDTLATALTVVHGDFSPKNILIKANQLILLDHEVMHTGDPSFDIGFCLAHLLSKANYRENQRDSFIQAAQLFWRTYAARRRGEYAERSESGELISRSESAELTGPSPSAGSPANSASGFSGKVPDQGRAIRHTMGCLLSRVAGRSPLEYLDEPCRERQIKVVSALMQEELSAVPEFIDAFGAALKNK